MMARTLSRLLPAEKKEGLATTITQQAGSILLEVEKKNVKHFEVETPYLAAVVKGTQFRVTVSASGATVDVTRGQVEVSDFKSGQIAMVMPGQHTAAKAVTMMTPLAVLAQDAPAPADRSRRHRCCSKPQSWRRRSLHSLRPRTAARPQRD